MEHKIYVYDAAHEEGLIRTRNTWKAMRQRCRNRKGHNAKYYVLKGIRVCKRWDQSFQAFVEDMGIRPDGTTIDRIDSSKGYYKWNCRWATPREQAANIGSLREQMIAEIDMILALSGLSGA